jgi:hypothetical protein
LKLKDLISNLFALRQKRSKLNNLDADKSFEEKYNELGVFTYFNDGFKIDYEDFKTEIKWDDITQLIAFKKDLMTIDRVDMQIVCGDKALTISEDLAGWYQFVLKTKEVFPSIPKYWDINIIQPAFATNLTIIYDKTKV